MNGHERLRTNRAPRVLALRHTKTLLDKNERIARRNLDAVAAFVGRTGVGSASAGRLQG